MRIEAALRPRSSRARQFNFGIRVESGYLFHTLQRHGMWATVLAAALFRGFSHATMGISGVAVMFAMGMLYGFVYWRWRQLWPLIVAHSLQMLHSLLPQALAA